MAEEKILRIILNSVPEVQPDVRPLWPELVQEDFDEVVGIVDRYAGRVASFSLVDLEAHLEDNDVLLPANTKDWRLLFKEIQEAVVERRASKDEQRLWLREKIGRATVFILAELSVGSMKAAKPEAPSGSITPKRSTVAARVEPPKPTIEVASIFAQFDSRTVKSKELKALLVQADPEHGDELFRQLIQSGEVIQSTKEGSVFYSINSAEVARPKQASESREQSELAPTTAMRPLTETELLAATNIMDMLTAPGTHVNQGQTIKSLQQKFAGEINGRDFRKLLRVLESNRLVVINASANYGKARKSPKVLLRGQDTKGRWRNSRDGYIGRLRASEITN